MNYFSAEERKLMRIAIATRMLTIAIQFVGNISIIDHDAGVFLYPKNSVQKRIDKIVDFLFGGFIRWDAQYFMHIVKYDYSYENVLAFFPAYPYSIKFVVLPVLLYILPILNEDSGCILAFLLTNCVLFISTTIILFKLSCIILNRDLAYKAAVLFCINPATVFFLAPYTECFYSFLTFYSMLNYAKLKQHFNKYEEIKFKWKYILYLFPLALSTCTRSNGILNLGFVMYLFLFITKGILTKVQYLYTKIFYLLKCSSLCGIILFVCIWPFIYVQIIDYYMFCTDFDDDLPQLLIDYAEQKHFRIPGKFSKYNQSWCSNKIPLAYSYVQEHYWNVGFLRYFEFKQIPNFLLASPLIFITIRNSFVFFRENMSYCICLGLYTPTLKKDMNTENKYALEMFVFVVHAFILTVFCSFCIHVQVTTRILCSASPVLYWFCAYYFKDVKDKDNSLLDVFIQSKTLNRTQTLIKYYFLGYFVIGTVLFCNFLPWT